MMYKANKSWANAREVPELEKLLKKIREKGIPREGVPISECKKRLFKDIKKDEAALFGADGLEIEIRGNQPYLVPKKVRGPREIVIFTSR